MADFVGSTHGSLIISSRPGLTVVVSAAEPEKVHEEEEEEELEGPHDVSQGITQIHSRHSTDPFTAAKSTFNTRSESSRSFTLDLPRKMPFLKH